MLHRLLTVLCLSCLSVLAVAAALPRHEAGAASTDELAAVPGLLRQAVAAGDHADALSQLDALLVQQPESSDFWTYLQGRVHVSAGRPEEAMERFLSVEEQPASAWRHKARFARAEVLRTLGRFAEAEALYEAEAARLSSQERKAELAGIYLGFADELSTPPAEPTPTQTAPDYARAHTLYAKVLTLDAPDALRARALFRMAECLQALERWDPAADAFEVFRSQFDPARTSAPAGATAPGTDVVRAAYGFATCRLRAGRTTDARRELEDLAGRVEDAADDDGAWRELFASLAPERRDTVRALAGRARFDVAATYPDHDARLLPLAVSALERFRTAYPAHPLVPDAAFAIANRYHRAGRQEDAVRAYDAFLATTPRTEAAAEDRERELGLRRRARFLRAQALMEQRKYAAAREGFEQFVQRFPDSSDWAAAQQGIVEAHFQEGQRLRELERFEEARTVWREFLDQHPLDGRARTLLLSLSELDVEHAARLEQKGDAARAKDLRRRAVDQWRAVATKYPGTNEASVALYRAGEVQEQHGELEAAIASYRLCTFGSHAPAAAARLGEMTRESLSVRTERSRRSTEALTVLAQVRNVEELEVQLYALDLEAYFRKHLTHQRIEDLDLDLISADHSFTYEVGDYERYAPLERTIELPVEGPGVWAVAVTAGDLRATTLVVRSDVDVIIKSSRREVFVFAEDRTAAQPAEGVRVLVALPGARADGAPLIRELVTDPQGVARTRFEELQDAQAVRVLAVRDGNYASNGFELSGLTLATGLTPRGYVYTERPAYQPGDTVHWRGVLREVDAQRGEYTVPAGEPLRVEVQDPRGRVFHRESVTLGDFGTAHGALTIDAHAAPGTYVLRCQKKDGPSFLAQFQVEEYQLRPIELELRTARGVFYRGETVEVEALARWYYGEPVADAPLQCVTPDGRRLDLRTDRRGRATFTFETRDFAGDQLLAVSGRLTEHGVEQSARVTLAQQGFRLGFTGLRNVYLAGEPVRIGVTARTAAAEPAERDVRLSVLRRESRPGGTWGEVLEEERRFRTDADGRGASSVTLERGGHYVLRAEGTDRFGQTILAERTVFVSGEDDEVKLRWIVERQELDVGEDLRLELVNREEPGLALICIEGEEILEHRIVRLGSGTNSVPLEVAPVHFPNFAITASMMRADRFHEARGEFAVHRRLTFEVRPARDTYQPGEEAEVELLVRDQLGRPVSAEVSLAVVDAALLELHPGVDGALRAAFERGAFRRNAALRTVSSCTFRYEGCTETISGAVLAEARRQEQQVQLGSRRALALESLAEATRPSAGLMFDFSVAGEPTQGIQANSAVQTAADARGRLGRLGYAGNADTGVAAEAFLGETAFWTPAVVTDAEGRAAVRFRLPERSTRWELRAIGVGPDTLLGEGAAELTTRAELFCELSLPHQLVEGDAPRLLVRVHNLTGVRGTADLKLRLSTGSGHQALPAQVELGDEPVVEVLFEATDALSGAGALSSLTAEVETVARLADGRVLEHTAREEVAVRPYGLARFDSRSGVLEGEADFLLALDPAAEGLALELFLGAGIDQLLVDAARGDGPQARAQRDLRLPPTHVDSAADLLGVTAVLELLRRSTEAESPDADRLRDRAQALVARLLAAQHEDGGWPWVGRRSAAQTESTARALVALGRASEAGLAVAPEAVDKATAWLRNAFRSAAQQDHEQKALIQYALAVHDRGDFGAVNRLRREAERLSPAALCYTTLALVEMERGPMAAELAQRIEALADAAGTARAFPTAGNSASYRSDLAMSALALYALERALPRSERLPALARALLDRRPWFPLRARGLAVQALAVYRDKVEGAQDRMQVAVTLGGTLQRSFSLDRADGTVRLAVEGDELRGLVDERGRLRVQLALTGRGEPQYTAVLSGFTRDLSRKNHEDFHVRERLRLASAPMYRGRTMPAGFSVLADSDGQWRNEVEHLELGARTTVQLIIRHNADRRASEAELDYLVLEAPLPAGARVLSGSVTGDFEAYEERPGRLLFHVGRLRRFGVIHYELVGSIPGKYRVLPPVVWDAYEPGRRAVGDAGELTVLTRGERSPDTYRETPDELYHVGLAAYADGDLDAARADLTKLYEEFGPRLREEPLREAATALLFMAIEREDSRDIVRYFELLKEKNPELYVPFEKVASVGRAYRELEEPERALLIFRALIEETFGKDIKVAGTLEEQGEFLGAMQALSRLWLEFPDLPAVVEAELALSDKLLEKAPKAAEDPELREAGVDTAQLTVDGIQTLRRFLTLYPEDPLAPEAALNLVSAYLSLEDYETASRLGAEMADLYPEPRFADTFRYTRAVADWSLGRDEEAVALLRRIAAATYPDAQGNSRPSENRDLALYILGQIYHARRDTQTASEYYEQVRGVFADALEALEGFRQKTIALPEVTTLRPGEEALVELTYRNIREAELLVYKVDLMTLYLREKNLSNITGVNLAGISPTLRRTEKLGDGVDLRPVEHEAKLDLEGPGAYLVICRGDERFASGLVLVSDMELEVREDAGAGRVRVQALDTESGAYLKDVDVRVIGAHDPTVLAGETDPRGLFVADSVQGAPTVIARLGREHYAFHRSPAALQPPEPQFEAGQMMDGLQQLDNQTYFQNVIRFNGDNRASRSGRWKEEVGRERNGVQVKTVK